MASMVGQEQFGRLLSIFRAVPYTDCAALQFYRALRKRMGLEIMNHLQFMFDIAQK